MGKANAMRHNAGYVWGYFVILVWVLHSRIPLRFIRATGTGLGNVNVMGIYGVPVVL